MDNIDGLGDLCPICGSALNEEHKKSLKAESDEKIRKINSEAQVLNQVEFKGKEELKSYEIELKNIENTLNDLKFLIEKISRLDNFKNQIISIHENIKHFDADLHSITKDSSELDEIDDYINYFESLLDKLKEYNRNQKELENIKYQYKKNINKIESNKESINVLKSTN